MRNLRILFFGTPEFAVAILKKLVIEGENVVGVITSPDKPAGRGRKLKQSAVKTYAISQNIPVLQPKNLKNEGFLEELKALHANLQIVVAFRMLPKVVWDMPKYGTFNLHASLLPQYRGAAPINWVIINGEFKTGVTTFFIDEKIDTGAIILNKEVLISKNETAGSLHDTLMIMGSELVFETVSLIKKNKTITKKQSKDDDLKEAPKLTSENTKINWDLSSKEIDAFIRGLNPYPTAWCMLKNNSEEIKVKIFESDYILENHTHSTGTILKTKKELKVAVPKGYIYIKEMQLPGKRKMEIKALLNGFTFNDTAKML